MSAARRPWPWFFACAAALLVALAWVTLTVLRLERAERHALARAQHETTLRLSLWRMDSWLAPQLAREAARPYFEYQAYFAQQKAYNRILEELQPGEVLTPSPLLAFRSELFPLHFQRDAQGRVTSPQLPTGNWLDLTQKGAPPPVPSADGGDARAALLARIERLLPGAALEARLSEAEAALPRLGCTAEVESLAGSRFDYQTRKNATKLAQVGDDRPGAAWVAPPVDVTVGPLLPLWIDDRTDGSSLLVFVRPVRTPGGSLLQGLVADWPRLRAALLAQLQELLPASATTLERLDAPVAALEARLLATVPAVLGTPPPAVVQPGWTGTRTMLVLVWLSVLAAILAVGATLRSAIALGERRARFASAVTHELRTPLTTFRMYSEMLALGMVEDPAQRHAYLTTLQHEADRLSRLVENVLCYARLEEGRYRGRRERIAVLDLLARLEPLLAPRVQAAGMRLSVSGETDARVVVDADAVAQILFNLVDNACKYARQASPEPLALTAAASAAQVTIALRDFGPGIPAAHRDAIFRPFDRGARQAGDSTIPGVGLGLALARGLAQDLGGTLELDPGVRPGARFVLTLPRAG